MKSSWAESERRFSDRIAAAVIVNQAVMKCTLLGLPPSADNIVRLIGDFFDPVDPAFSGVVDELMFAINEISALSVNGREPNH